MDWQTAELFLSIAKNPDLRDVCLFVLASIARLTTEDRQFQEFCSGIFSGVISQSSCLVPRALFDALPRDPHSWASLLKMDRLGLLRGPLAFLVEASQVGAQASGRLIRSPWQSVDWGMEIATKFLRLVEGQLGGPMSARRPLATTPVS